MSATQAARRASAAEVPVVDLAGLARGEAVSVADAIRAAAQHTGFFFITGHGIAPALATRARAAAADFFALPAHAKQDAAVDRHNRGYMRVGMATMYGAAVPDLKEVFFFGPEFASDDPDVLAGRPLMAPNRWPAAMPQLRFRIWPYYEAVMDCGLRVLGALALALDLDPGFFASRYRRPLGRAQLIHYPPLEARDCEAQLGAAPHFDYGCITLLLPDPHGGLQIRHRRGEWLAVPPIPGTLVVNIGDLLARWSGGRLRSTEHRVVSLPGRERLSIAVFCDPDSDAVVDPRDMGFDPGRAGADAQEFAPITAGEFIMGRNRGAFSHYRDDAPAVPAQPAPAQGVR